MTEKVTILRRDDLPMPLIYLASPEDLAAWHAGHLTWSLERGERQLAISCFDTGPAFGFPVDRAAQAVLRAVTDVLYEHPEAERLEVLCSGEACYRAYSLCWNMWYAGTKPHHEHED